MKRPLLTAVVATAALLCGVTTARADPTGPMASIYAVTCDELGSVEVSSVFFASDNARGTTSAFHVRDSQTVITIFTSGVETHPNDWCRFEWIGGDRAPEGWEFMEAEAIVVNG